MENFKINREKKTFVLDTGEEIPIPEHRQREVLRSAYGKKAKESEKKRLKGIYESRSPIGKSINALQESMAESFLGAPGKTAGRYIRAVVGAFTPKEGQEEMGFVDRILDQFYPEQEAGQEHLAEQSEQHPIASGIGKGLGMAGELVALRKLPAAAALPIMGAAHDETSFLEPGEKAPRLAGEALVGGILDKFFGGLNKVAGARQARRDVEGKIAQTEAENAAELLSVEEANAREANRFAQETTAREAEEQLIAQQQVAENKLWADTTEQRVNNVGKLLGKTPIEEGALGVEGFIENDIGRSANAGSKEGNFVSKFLKSIFKADKNGKVTSDNMQKGVRALDEAIIAQEGVTKQLLTDFRAQLFEQMPQRLADSFIFEKWGPKIIQRLTSGTDAALQRAIAGAPEVQKSFKFLTEKAVKGMTDSVNKSITEILGKYKGNFLEALQNGTIKQEIEQAVRSNPIYQKLSKLNPTGALKGGESHLLETVLPGYGKVKAAMDAFPETIIKNLNEAIDKNYIQMNIDRQAKMARIGSNVKVIPQSPNVVPAPAPVAPAQVATPNIQPVPTIPQPQGIYERLAHGLENLPTMGQAYKSARRHGTAGLAAHMVGLPLGKTIAAGLGAAKGAEIMTRPGATANTVRASFKMAGIEAIDSWAQQYSSYHDGILEDPLERRSLTKEIENDAEIPIEQKAIAQSKVNRGKPISAPL